MARTDPAVPSSRPSGRVLPSNLQAEESLLGAMLLSRDAIAAAAEIVRPEHFYKPAHAHIYDAILSLYGSGEPVDPITLSDELARGGLLEIVGGPGALVALQTNAPAISNAARYGRIIEELALLRRMIAVAGEIAELGYSMPDDVMKAVDSAEALVFDLAQHRQAGTTATIRQLLEQSLDRLEQLYERGEAITGTPTGYLDLDDLLAGLQPNALVVIGARPAMGKALALDTPLPTPNGWITMAQVQVGDRLFDEMGRPCRVTYTTPVLKDHECFQVGFDDGSALVADAEHQWIAHRYAGDDVSGPCLVTTRQMFEEAAGCKGEGGSQAPSVRWSIDCAEALVLPSVELPVDPYLVGRRLSGSPCSDLRSAAGSAPGPAGGGDTTRLVERTSTRWAEDEVLLSGYLRGSREQRAALLQGLVDSGAGVERRSGRIELRLPDRRLAEQARELVCSLGQSPDEIRSATHGEAQEARGSAGPIWTFGWSPQPLDPCKGAPSPSKGRRMLTSIEPTVSVPVRCITVDSPSHLYLAGSSMVPTHNTSFALGMASHAALVGQRPVLFFSLEMSQVEITQRVLCSEARVDATRVRNGKLNEGDWEKISHTVGRLAEAPIWIDDNPNVTVMEIRSKARKLKSQVGDLGLVVVDYIQLMTGRSGAESRQVEVAEISRGLKILAREIETPVVALAQLNRGLEQRADKRPMLSDLRESGCLPASTRIQRADNGEQITIGELVLTQEQPLVWSVDEHQRLVPARLLRTFSSGIKPVFMLRLASGLSVNATANHPFLTIQGWSRLDSLEPGSFIAVPRRLPDPVGPTETMSDEELALLAHMLGDGTIGPSFEYTTADAANKEVVEDHNLRHQMRGWLEPLGLWKSRSSTKFVPPSIFGLSASKIALFLHYLWATDGSITQSRNGKVSSVRVCYATTSPDLALDVQRLLLRLGIKSVIGRGALEPRDGGTHRPGYSVRVQGADDQARFLREVGCFGQRGKCIAEALERLDGINANANGDLVPSGIVDQVKAAMQASGVTQRELEQALHEQYSGSGLLGSETRTQRLSRDWLRRVGEFTASQRLVDVATSDLYWDEVIEIVPLGDQPTFDATIEGTHNFVADGVVVHNSLEQDADVVMFLYRDEIYNRESPDQGIAEVIVAKHRSGPTGLVRLAFLGQYTKFVNMAR